ncbi:hypothetical protein A6R68_21323, partial [Neotoma lepida]
MFPYKSPVEPNPAGIQLVYCLAHGEHTLKSMATVLLLRAAVLKHKCSEETIKKNEKEAEEYNKLLAKRMKESHTTNAKYEAPNATLDHKVGKDLETEKQRHTDLGAEGCWQCLRKAQGSTWHRPQDGLLLGSAPKLGTIGPFPGEASLAPISILRIPKAQSPLSLKARSHLQKSSSRNSLKLLTQLQQIEKESVSLLSPSVFAEACGGGGGEEQKHLLEGGRTFEQSQLGVRGKPGTATTSLVFKEELKIEKQNQELPNCHLFVPCRRPGELEKRDGASLLWPPSPRDALAGFGKHAAGPCLKATDPPTKHMQVALKQHFPKGSRTINYIIQQVMIVRSVMLTMPVCYHCQTPSAKPASSLPGRGSPATLLLCLDQTKPFSHNCFLTCLPPETQGLFSKKVIDSGLVACGLGSEASPPISFAFLSGRIDFPSISREELAGRAVVEDWDSFLRSLQIAILVLQKMLESAAGICKGGR